MEKWKHLEIQLTSIKNATNNFERLIGYGGYGSVYEGKLLINEKYVDVAVKRLNKMFGQGLKEFLTEIDLLSSIQHNNLITLVGYCDEEDEKILVYEYAKNGSLERYITPSNISHNLTWLERLQIVVDAARGLDHLHNHLRNNQVIIHRDIKSSNILLDHNWVAKISDFGLSKLSFGGIGKSTVITYAVGTHGYVAPEILIHNCMVTKESDVYSFGMVLFEVLCGRLCNNEIKDGILLTTEVAKEYYSKNKLDEIVDPVLIGQMKKNSLELYSTIAYRCLQERHQRPLMNEVKKKLEEALRIQVFYSQRPEGNHLEIPCEEIHAAIDFSQPINPNRTSNEAEEYEGSISVNGIYTKVRIRSFVANRTNRYEPDDHEYKADLKLLMVPTHENVTTLVGTSYGFDYFKQSELYIVYEYAEHGTLDQHIRCSNTNHTLTWLERLKVMVDVARGLNYLRKYVNILYINVVSSKVLLFDKCVAKISGDNMLESARYFYKPENRSCWEREPELYLCLGMLLFELVCGRLSTIYDYENNGGLLLSPAVAKQHYASKELDKIIDPILRKQMSLESLTKVSALAYKCLQMPHKGLLSQPHHPSLMIEVQKELEETLKLEVLHWRCFFSRHWYILNVNDLSSGMDIVMMQHEDTKRLEGPSGTREEETNDDEQWE